MKKLAKDGYLSSEALDTANSTLSAKKALLASNQEGLDDTVLRAPFAGTIGAKNINVGDYAASATKLVRLVNRQQLKVIYHLPQADLSKVHLGQNIQVTAKAYPNKIFTAKISFIAPDVDPDTGTFEVHALLNNKNDLLAPGEYINVTQDLGAAQQELLIPESALQSSIQGDYVFVVRNNKAVKQSVTAGQHIDNSVVISKGLNSKDWVVVMGQKNIKNGLAVKITQYNAKANS